MTNSIRNLLIAEVGSVHDGSFGNAQKLIHAAVLSGASAVKFQTHIATAESLAEAPSPSYFKDESRIEYFQRTSFTLAQLRQLKDICDELGVLFMSSPFSLEAVDILDSLDMEVYKIPSGEVTNLPLLQRISELNKPVLLSSGMSNWDELDQAVEIFKGKCPLTVMQCTSKYPCPPNSVGLNIIQQISERYKCDVGFSDHTLGISAPIAAAALGATVIEKHFTFSRLMYGSDAQHSIEPDEFRLLSNSLNDVWQMLETPIDKNNIESFVSMKEIFQKSIVASCDLPSSTIINPSHLSFKKPGTGISASLAESLLGKKLTVSVSKDHLFNWSDFK